MRLWSILALVAVAGSSACTRTGGDPRSADDLGVAYSPRGHTASTTTADATAFYANHSAFGEIVAYHMNWRDEPGQSGQIPIVAQSAQAARESFKILPVTGFGFTINGVADLTSQTQPTTNSWDNDESRIEFADMVAQYAEDFQPRYIFLGNETNIYFLDHSQQEWDDWIVAFGQAYDAIKAVSPDTMVFTVFQLERMKGLGAKNGWSDPPQWDLIADHGVKLDAVGFTSYPYFEYDTPSQIPAEYYNEILSHWSGPVAFTEIGWLASASGPYTGGEADQVTFLSTFEDRTKTINIEYTVWLFLHDVDSAPVAFTGIGLRTNDGQSRPVEDAWKQLVQRH